MTKETNRYMTYGLQNQVCIGPDGTVGWVGEAESGILPRSQAFNL